jgi:hypothetical protein
MKTAILELLKSKRVLMSVLGVVAWEQLTGVLYPFVAYILGQSYRDGQQIYSDRYLDKKQTVERVAIEMASDPHKRTPEEITAEIAAYKGALGG